ncbi:restriction endonuclease subunit R [Pseudanabaena sp. FACHB-2040]|uniref:type I restriction endonuclease n=1 Tax=Pseudanabaena sp. FACHB-2040 TaxID=2692859 RepID=UPI0016889839|nr:restriction endonuclease subunit R [Pseudanabaena sp. FACHB-2040]MBD2258488.1 restriction endonuclease subunit R [Pseudanabaena sp. FACHB-2040]
MVQTVAIEQLTLYDLEQQFGLQEVEDNFFSEWQGDWPALTAVEQERLTRVEAAYANLERRSLLENTVKLAVVAPLLDLAGVFLPPFYVTTEKTVEIVAEGDEQILRGRLDVLVLKDQLWVLVIESKRAEFSLKVGIPQVLGYMLAAPVSGLPLFGMVTNGSSFVFLKLVRQGGPRYARSKEFILDQDEGLARTLQIMKGLAALVANS